MIIRTSPCRRLTRLPLLASLLLLLGLGGCGIKGDLELPEHSERKENSTTTNHQDAEK
jgi:predicted small lipoprotein YifL